MVSRNLVLNRKVLSVWSDERLYQERRLVQREALETSCSWCFILIENEKITNALKDKAILPPTKKSPQILSAALCNHVVQGGEESKRERTLNKSWEGKATLCAGTFAVGFCRVYFTRVLLITNMTMLVSGFGQIPLRYALPCQA